MTSKIELGKFQELIVVKQTDFGVFLNTPTGAEQDKILLPKAHVPQGTQLKDVLNVFVYKDSEDRPIATTLEWTWDFCRHQVQVTSPLSHCTKIRCCALCPKIWSGTAMVNTLGLTR